MDDRDALIEDLVCRCLDARAAGEPGACESLLAGQPREVQDLVAAMLGTLDRVGLGGAALSGPETDGAVAFGPYLLLERLGAGAMGVVYRARDPGGSERAIKVLQPGLLSARRARQRFEREVSALRELAHPGICPILDAGEVDGVPFLVMPLLLGENLQARFARGPARDAESRRQLLAIVGDLAAALHHAHERGFVHRDVKPANVFVAADGRPVLLDFGLARLDREEAVALSMSHEVIGAPAYMAPEQIVDGRAVDRRADVYALGVLLYEGLTGRCPYEAATRESLYRRILTGDVQRPSAGAPEVSPALDVVCLTALAREPDRRYQTAAAFARDLARVQAGERPLAQLPGRLWRARRWIGRNPLPSTLVALLLLAVVGVMLQTVNERRAFARDRARALAAEAFEVLPADPDRALELGLAAHAMAPDVLEALTAIESAQTAEREEFVLRGHTQAVVALDFAADGSRLVSASRDGTARVWDLAAGTSVVIPHGGGGLAFARLQPLGQIVVTAGRDDGRLCAWSARDGSPLWRQAAPAAVHVVCWSPDGRWLLVGGAGGAWVWSPAGERHELVATEHAITAAVWLDGSRAAVGTGAHRDGTVGSHWLRIATVGGGVTAPPVGCEALAGVVSLHLRPAIPDRLLVVGGDVGTGKGRAFLWRIAEDRLDALKQVQVRGVQGAGWCSDTVRAVTIALGGIVGFWNQDGELLRTADAINLTTGIAPHPRLPFAALSSGFGLIQLRSFEGAGTELLGRRRLRPLPLTFSPDGRRLAATAWDDSVRVWSMWRPEHPSYFIGDVVRSAVWVDGGRRIATGSERRWGNRTTGTGVVRTWSTDDGGLVGAAVEVETPVCDLLVDRARDRLLVLHGAWSSGGVQVVGDAAGNLRAGRELAADPSWLLPRQPIDSRLLDDGRVVVVEVQQRLLLGDAALTRTEHSFAVAPPDAGLHGDSYLIACCAASDGSSLWCGGASGHLFGFDRRVDGAYGQLAPVDMGQHIQTLDHVADGSLLVGQANGVLVRWFRDGRRPIAFVGHRADIVDTDWSAATGELLVASSDYAGNVRLWRGDGSLLREMRAHTGPVWSVSFSPHGDRLLTASEDGTARIWPVHFAVRR